MEPSSDPVTPAPPPSYPVTFSVDYPDRNLNRLTTAFRIFTVIPIAIVSWLLADGSVAGSEINISYLAGAGMGLVTMPTVLMILFRQKYPRWWYVWNLELMRFSSRIGIYISLMDDRYPSTDEEQAVHLDFPYPDVKADLKRGMPLVKWLLAIPHYVVLFFLYLGSFIAVVIAWFAILFTGRYPKGLFDFVEGVYRWQTRVLGYAFALVTDKYPPFRLGP